MISTEVRLSRFPVGSSARRMEGRLTSAARWPPAAAGLELRREVRRPIGEPTSDSAARDRRRRSRLSASEYRVGSSTLSSADVRASRLKPWNTNPIVRFRIAASRRFSRRDTSIPSSSYCPEVGRSRHPRMFINVDFPLPLAPMIATNPPRSTAVVTPQRVRAGLAERVVLGSSTRMHAPSPADVTVMAMAPPGAPDVSVLVRRRRPVRAFRRERTGLP